MNAREAIVLTELAESFALEVVEQLRRISRGRATSGNSPRGRSITGPRRRGERATYMTRKQVMDALGMASRTCVVRLEQDGVFRTIRADDGRTTLIVRADVEAYASSRSAFGRRVHAAVHRALRNPRHLVLLAEHAARLLSDSPKARRRTRDAGSRRVSS